MAENTIEHVTDKSLLESGKQILLGLGKISNSLDELKKLDTQLTEISKFSRMTSEQLKALGDSSFATASQYGKPASDYLSAVQDMNSRGYTGQKNSDMAEMSLMAQAAGNLPADTAGNYLAAVDAAYQYAGSVKKLTDMLDGQQNIATRNRIAMTDMASATSIAAQTAADSGIKINELSALIASGLQDSKKSGEEVGTTLNTIFESFENPSDISPDVFVSLLNGKGNYQQLIEDYASGSGSAMDAVHLQSDSLEGSLIRLSNTWDSVLGNIADSGVLQTTVNALDKILGAVDGITSFLGPITSLGAVLGGFAATKNVGRRKMFRPL